LSHFASLFFFVLGILDIRPQELFAKAALQLWSYWSLPPESLGLQTWATGAWIIYLFVMNICDGIFQSKNRTVKRTYISSDIALVTSPVLPITVLCPQLTIFLLFLSR
jgi:hypothetical protein